ncbi:MAG TPA: site-specific integrase [Steroidobacteraceae bacterium]|nr:site-specific integrase [Steroidobacteraceae bacterium]
MPTVALEPENLHALPHLGSGVNHQCIYWDAKLECFGVRVYPSGRRAYVCAYRFHGRKRLTVLARVERLSLDEARTMAVLCLARAAGGDDPKGPSRRKRSAKTVAQLCMAFIEQHARAKRLNWKTDQSVLRRRLLPTHRHRLAAAVTSADIEPIHRAIGTQHPYAANHFLDLVRVMFNWGKVAGFVPRDHPNPGAGIGYFPERRRRRYITHVEMAPFIRALEAEDNEYARHGLWMLLLTGLRMRELLKARWDDIDWEMGTLFIGLTKNGEPLLTPLSDPALARLKAIPRIADNPYIICGRKPGHPLTGLKRPLERIAQRAGLASIRVHDIRRTVGSWLAQAGTSLHLIGDVLNHRDLKTTLGYAYFQTQQRRDALADHGNRVLSFAAEPLRLTAAPPVLSVEHVLQPKGSPARHRHYFSREALHELVWTAPATEISEQLGVSDVALAKLCRRAAIPRPGRGYWARVEAGQRVARVPLPPPPGHLPELLRIRGNKPVAVAAAS